MNIIKAYYYLNIKTLSKDKLPFVWSVLLPGILVILNKGVISNILDMRFFWTYIIFSSYVLGIGMDALRQKEAGTLKTYFSIKESRIEFFIASLLTQITFCFISIFIVNIIAMIILGLNFFKMCLYSIELIVLSIPVAFLFFNITLIKNIHYNSLNTLISIVIFIALLIMPMDTFLNLINPLKYMSEILFINTSKELILFIIISSISVLSGIYSIKNYSVTSNETR